MLTYSISRERLFGRVGSKDFDLYAVSGGGRGRTKGSADQTLAGWSTWRKANQKKGVRGGPLPPGLYIVHAPVKHVRLGRAAYLEQTVSSILQFDATSSLGITVTDRDGFFIHGRGPSGSDGCIVPMEGFKQLLDAIATAAPIALKVVDEGITLPASNGSPGVQLA